MLSLQTHTLIIGGGPAGSLCGISLQQHHSDCLLVDRARFPRLKLCAGVVTGKAREVLREVLGDDGLRSHLSETQVGHERHLRLWNRRHCFVDCDMQDRRVVPAQWRDEDWRFVLVDRPRFDAALIAHYKALGGQLIEDNGVRTIDFDRHIATLTDGTIVEYRNLVAADGAGSHTERLLAKAAPDFQPKGENALAYEINVSRDDLDIDGVNLYFGYLPETYAWAFAKGDTICLGACRLKGVHVDGQQAMRRFLGDIGLRHPERYPLKGALIPFDNAMPHPLWRDHVYFVGDAAGLDEAVTGEGIYFALRSGADAASAIAKANPVGYIQRNSVIQQHLRRGAKYQRLLASRLPFAFFRTVATMSNPFVGYFYLTQIDHLSFTPAPSIVAQYLRHRIG